MSQCVLCKKEFLIETEDKVFYKKMGVPAPAFCPNCRKMRRLVWRNERNLYIRTCDLCKNNTLSMYPQNAPFPVYCAACFKSDKWDRHAVGRDFDFSRGFFEQFAELQKVAPRPSVLQIESIGCDFASFIIYSKNSYFSFSVVRSENVYYGHNLDDCKETADSANSFFCELCYEAVNSRDCYGSQYVERCEKLIDCFLCRDCFNCQNCFGCWNLRNKKYCWFNKQLSKEDWEAKFKEAQLHSYSKLLDWKKQYNEKQILRAVRHAVIEKSENCTGNNIFSCKNIKFGFDVRESEDCKYIERAAWGCKDVYDAYGAGSELCYDIVAGLHANSVKFSVQCTDSTYSEYIEWCMRSAHMFGCVGLDDSKYCVLNKKYTENGYINLRKKIIEQMKNWPYNGLEEKGVKEWGQFFPQDMSVFGYNESIAMDFEPMGRQEAQALGFKWNDSMPGSFNNETLKPPQIPDSINSTDESITKEVLACTCGGECASHAGLCGRNYKIIKQELAFYKKIGVPLPRECVHCRFARRIKQRGQRHLWRRECICTLPAHEPQHRAETKCTNIFETIYSPKSPEKVFCEFCYKKEVI